MMLSLQKSQKSGPVKVVPRSVTILWGTPKRWVMSSMNLAASFDVTLATARTSIHLVNLSMRTGASEDRWMVAPGCDD
jgi:hypothetical protein